MLNIGLRIAGTSKHRNSGFSHYNTVTIDHTKVGGSNSSNFPMVFFGTYAQLATVAHGGYATNSNGYDIIFSTDTAGTMTIPFELVNYNQTTGYFEAWVNIATLSHTVDTVIYLQVGNNAISTNQSNPAGVWGSGYKAVYHFGSTSVLSGADSSQSSNTLTNFSGSNATGIIGGGLGLSGGQYMKNTAPSGLPTGGSSPIAIEGWFKLASNTAQEVFGFGNNTVPDCRIAVFYDGSGNLMSEFGGVGNPFAWTYDTNWHHVAVVMPSGQTNINQTLLYFDGVLKSPTLGSATLAIANSGIDIAIGAIPRYYGILPAVGTLDEIHMGAYQPSADFILAEYNNQNSPSTFYAVT
jgi:hypothetical protein